MSIREKIKQNGIFFWRKKPKTASEQLMEMIPIFIEYMPQIRNLLRNNNDVFPLTSSGKLIGQMYDFYEDQEETRNQTMIEFDEFGHMKREKKADERLSKKPKEVVGELDTIPVPFDLIELDEKIEIFGDKSTLSNQRYAKAQIDGFIKRLQNRKHYKDNLDFYTKFQNTNDEKIDQLLLKYKLVMKTSDLFVPTFPKEAIDIMKEYTRVTEKFSSESPVYYVIAEEKDFEKKREKLDPILLVQSPFGFYWQILGAWDQEMLLLSEL